MPTLRRILASAAALLPVAGLAVAAAAPGAAAHRAAEVAPAHASATVPTGPAAGGGRSTEWVPYHQEDLSYAAGEACAFALTSTVVSDDEYYRNVAFYSDGAAHTQLFRGALVIRWTNTETDESVVRDQSGRAFLEYRHNGLLRTLTAQSGHFSARLTAGSSPGKGMYYVGGAWSAVDIHPDATRTLVLGPHGTSENLCRTLAG